MIGNTIAHYRIIEELGRGGMGVVYKAEDTKLKRTVALKFLPPELTRDPEAKQRFIHEAQVVSALQHSNICTLHDIDETQPDTGEPEEGRLFIVMDYYDGETLKEKIAQGPLPVEEVIDLGVQIASALQEAHSKGIIHRDIKPTNIIITRQGQVKVLDFGLAKMADQTRLTRENTTLGTVAYMSPEQTRGEKVDHRTDIWSLGILLYEMLTGKSPFKGDYDQALIYSIVSESPPPPTTLRTGVPMELERIIGKALSKDTAERYQHVEDLLVDLKGVGNTISYKYTERPSAASKRHRKWLIPVFGFLIVLLVFWLFSLLGLFDRQKDNDDTFRMKIVVMPFENLGNQEHDYFAEGITEEIISSLASLRNLGVISRQSAFHYADSRFTTEQIGKELAVDFILTGTVRWAPVPKGEHRVRITAHVVRVKDDIEIWTRTYEHILEDIFRTQSDIATNVVNALGITLEQPHREFFAEKPTENLEAYQAYLRGRWFTNRPHFSVKDWKNAIQNFEKAVALDTLFALVYAELAKAHARLYYLRYDVSENRLRLADETARKAARLNPESAEVRLALGYYYLWAYRDRSRALEEWAIAEKEMPNNVKILMTKAYAYEPQGRWEEAIRVTRRAFELSPKDASLPTSLALFHWLTRRYEQASAYSDQAIALAPDAVWPYLYKTFIHWSWKGADDVSRESLSAAAMDTDYEWYLWSWYFQEVGEGNFQDALDLIERTTGEWSKNKLSAMPKDMLAGFIYNYLDEKKKAVHCFEKSIPLLRKAVDDYPDDPRYHSSLGIALAGTGRKEEALREGKQAVALLPLSKDRAYGLPYALDLAVIYAMVGDVDTALEQLEPLLKDPSWYSPEWIMADIRFAPLFGNPKFEALTQKYSVNQE